MDIFNFKYLFLACCIFIPLERLFASHKEQPVLRRGWLNDLIYWTLNDLLVRLGLMTLIVPTAYIAGRLVPSWLSGHIESLPLWIQIPLIMLLADLGCYWMHRTLHTVPWMWRFHAVHHSVRELDWLATNRSHPLDEIAIKGASLIPVFALGFSTTALGWYAIFFYWQAVFIHSNIRLPFGPLRFLLSSPEFHHWHHSKDREARDKNFAAQLPFLDMAFGTFHMPSGRAPEAFGIDDHMPDRYVPQLIHPFLTHGKATSD